MFLFGNAWAQNDHLKTMVGNFKTNNSHNAVAKQAADDAKIYGITGELLWKFQVDEGLLGFSSLALGPDGTLYFISEVSDESYPFRCSHYLYAINPDGTEKWVIKTEAAISGIPIIDENGWIYFSCYGTDENKFKPYFYAISPSGGVERKGDDLGSFMGLDFQSNPLFIVDADWRLSRKTQWVSMNFKGMGDKENWSTELRLAPDTRGGIGSGRPLVTGPDGDMYGICGFSEYIGTTYKEYQGLEAFDKYGVYKWSFKITEPTYLADGKVVRADIGGSPAIDWAGNLYFGAVNNVFYALNKKGEFIWSCDFGIIPSDDPNESSVFYDGFWSSPVLGDGKVYVCSQYGRIYALSMKNGDIIWETDLDNTYCENSPLLGQDGILYVDAVYALDARDGTEKGHCAWVDEKDNVIMPLRPLIISPEGIWYFYSDGYFCALDTGGEHKLAKTAWPMSGANPQQTYRVNPKPPTAVEEISPRTFSLGNAFPNPFNPMTTIPYTLAKTGEVKIVIYNAVGQKVTMLVNGRKEAGNHSIVWDASRFSSGLYFYTMQAEGFLYTKKLVLLK